MTTRPVRFELMCDKEHLEYNFPLPTTPVRPDRPTTKPNSPTASLQPLFHSYETKKKPAPLHPVRNAEFAAHPARNPHDSPMSWLHLVDDPFVKVIASPTCQKGECVVKMRQKIQVMMMELAEKGSKLRPEGPKKSFEVLPRGFCGQVGKTLKCGHCKAVGYCGKEHQKKDWKKHKAVCKEATS